MIDPRPETWTPEEEIECYLLSRRELVPHEWMKEQIDYWIAELHARSES